MNAPASIGLRQVRPRPLLAGDDELVDVRAPQADEVWATVMARVEGVELAAWTLSHAPRLRELVERVGAVLLRGFAAPSPDALRRLVNEVDGAPMAYRERSTPRTDLGAGLYTSTEYPADEEIALHSEFSYGNRWPSRLWFHCVHPAASGGETLLASTERMLQAVPAAVLDRFERLGVRYVRHYGLGVDLSWQEVFQSTDVAEVEAYCKAEDVRFEWLPGGTLRTWQDRPACVVHPVTGRKVWFNQADLFHPSGLPAVVREGLVLAANGGELPRTASFANGSPMAEAELDEVRRVGRSCAVKVPWRAGDTLVIDNLRFAHGRCAYTGNRRVLVMMTAPARRDAAAPCS